MMYYYLISKKNYLFKDEPFEEIFRERNNYYISKNKNIDFWIVSSLKCIENSKEFFDSYKTNNYCYIVSTNREFIEWLKLRFKNFI